MKFEDWKKLKGNKNKTLNDYYAYLRSNDKMKFEKFNESNFKSDSKNKSHTSPKVNSTKSSNWHYLIWIGLISILFITNPSLSEHKDGIIEKIQTEVSNEVGDLGLFNGIKDWTLDKLGRGAISVTNRRTFIVFSVCDVSVLGAPYGYSIGILGNVWIIENNEF